MKRERKLFTGKAHAFNIATSKSTRKQITIWMIIIVLEDRDVFKIHEAANTAVAGNIILI